MEYNRKYKMRIFEAEEIEDQVNDIAREHGLELFSMVPWRFRVLENVSETTHYLVTFIREGSLYDT